MEKNLDINFILSKVDKTKNYQKELDKLIIEIQKKDTVPTLLLHSCCGPCSSYCLEYLSQYFQITVFYYNPNIYPSSEYNDRIEEQLKIINNTKAKYPISFIEGEYNPKIYYETIKGYENEKEGFNRCTKCYDLRISKAAEMAEKLNFDYFATSLTISPHKNSYILNYIGNVNASNKKTKYLNTDFKKKNGFKRSVEITQNLNIYRQEYCGCIFSKKEMEKRLNKKDN